MSFSLSGTVITQSGTDSNLSGLGNISGVTKMTSDILSEYFVGSLQLLIQGTLSWNPDTERVISGRGQGGIIVDGGTLNFGKLTTVGSYSYPSQGTGYVNMQVPNAWYGAFFTDDLALKVRNSGTVNWLGGTMYCPNNGFSFDVGTSFHVQSGVFVSGAGNADAGRQIISIMAAPATGNGFKMTGGELYLYSDFASGSLTGLQVQGAGLALDANQANYMTFRDIDVGSRGNVVDVAIHTDLNHITLSRITVLGSVTGTALTMIGADTSPTSSDKNTGYISVQRPTLITVQDISGTAVQNARGWIRDTNHGARKNLNGFDDTADKTYVLSTDSTGATTTQNIICGIVNVFEAAGRGTANSDVYSVDLRGKTNTLGDDLFDVHCIAYGFLPQTQQFSARGIGTLNANFILLADSSIGSITESAAGALTSITNLDQLYAASKFWKTRNVLAQLEYPTSTTLPLSVEGDVLNLGALNINIDATASVAFNINTSTNTITIKCSTLSVGTKFNNFKTTGTVLFLNGASPNTNLIYTDISGTSVPLTAPNLISGTRVQIYDLTGSYEIRNEIVLTSGGYSRRAIWEVDRTFRLRAAYTNGAISYLPIESIGTFTNNGISFLDSQVLDTVYNTNNISGLTVTEFSADYTNSQIDVNDSDGTTTVQRLYAWLIYNMLSSSGISQLFNVVQPDDLFNYKFDTSIANLKIKNTGSTPVIITGGRVYRSDKATIIASGGSIQMDPNSGTADPNQIADALLNRDMSIGLDTNARTPRNALRALRNKISVSSDGSTLTVTKEDDTATAWTAAVTSTAGAAPIVGIDPA